MNAHGSLGQAALKSSLFVLLVVLAFQSFGITGLAAPAAPIAASHSLQAGGNPPVLTCGCASVQTQVVFLIDDSGSMRANDPEFGRNQRASDLVDGLAALQDAQVAVIHFTEGVKVNSGWMNTDPESLDKEINRNQGLPYTLEPTDFSNPLRAAKTLFMQAPAGDCIRRSVLLFTDGILEGPQGRLTRAELSKEFEEVLLQAQEIPQLDEMYFIGFRAGANDWDEAITQGWSELLAILSTSEEAASLPVLFPSADAASGFERIMASLSDPRQDEDLTDLARYQAMTVKFDPQPVRLPQGHQSSIRFSLVDGSGKAVLPDDDPAYTLELNVSVSQGVEEMLGWKQDGDHYSVSWTPGSSGVGQFRVLANLVDAKGHTLLNCSGAAAEMQVDPSTPTPTGMLPPSSTPGGTVTPTGTPTGQLACIGCAPVQCLACQGSWKFWFWPLALLMLGMLIVLLVLRLRKIDQEEKQAVARASRWGLLFLPFLILLVFLVLNRLWWCCAIPPWLFLLLIVILVLIPLPVSLIPRDISPRRRPWWLVVLLILLALIWFFFPRITIPAIAFIALILFSVWSIRWFILPIPGTLPPAGPRPDDPPEEKKKKDDTRPEKDNLKEKDDLTRIEGIGEAIKDVLKDNDIITFEDLANSDIETIQSILNKKNFQYKNPKTWPLQARLAAIASASKNWDSFNAYLAYLKDGLPPQERKKPQGK